MSQIVSFAPGSPDSVFRCLLLLASDDVILILPLDRTFIREAVKNGGEAYSILMEEPKCQLNRVFT